MQQNRSLAGAADAIERSKNAGSDLTDEAKGMLDSATDTAKQAVETTRDAARRSRATHPSWSAMRIEPAATMRAAIRSSRSPRSRSSPSRLAVSSGAEAFLSFSARRIAGH